MRKINAKRLIWGLLPTVLICLVPERLLAQQNANIPQIVRQAEDGKITLHSSTGLATGSEIAYMPEWKAFGWFRADGKVEWDVIVTKGGRYEVVLEWSVSDEEAGKKFVLQADREELAGVVPKSGSWETFKSQPVGYIKLKAGKKKIIFKPLTNFGEGALLDFREILLVPQSK